MILLPPLPPFPLLNQKSRGILLFWAGPVHIYLREPFSPAHPQADIFHLPQPPIVSQSIYRDVPLAQRGPSDFPPLIEGKDYLRRCSTV